MKVLNQAKSNTMLHALGGFNAGMQGVDKNGMQMFLQLDLGCAYGRPLEVCSGGLK